MIRWKNLAAAGLFVAVLWALTHFFLDRAIRRGIEAAGTAANGAVVDLRGVRTRFFPPSILLRGLQVTNADDPMRNVVEIGALRFSLEGRPLFWKKFVVDRAEITDIRLNTPRRRSGALPTKAAAGQETSVVAEKSREAASFAWGNLKDAYDPKTLFAPDQLASLRLAREAQAHFQSVAQVFPGRLDALKTDDLAQRIRDFTRRVQSEKFSGLEGIERARTLAKEAESLNRDIRARRDDFHAVARDLKAETARARDTLRDLDRLKKQDLDNAVGRLRQGFSVEGLSRGLLGPAWFAKLQTALRWLQKAEKLAPAQTADASAPPPPPPRRLGRDHTFPFHYHWPAFHLKQARLTGETPGNNPLAYAGTLRDVSSDPSGLGRPIALDLEGSKNARRLNITASLDFSGPALQQDITLAYQGVALGGLRLGDMGGPITVASGTGRAHVKLHALGSALEGRIEAGADPLVLTHATDEAGDRWSTAVHDVLAGLTRVDATLLVSGTLAKPVFGLTTTLDNQLKAALQQSLQKQWTELQDQARRRLEELVGDEQNKLRELTDKQLGGLSERLGLKDKDLAGLESAVDKLLNDLKSQGTKSLLGDKSGDLKNLKNLFKKK